MKNSQRHLIKCRCILKQNKNSSTNDFFAFITCSLVIDGVVQTSFAECPNCGILHKIIDICRSEIINKSDLAGVTKTIDDIKLSLPEKLVTLLSAHELDISTWQHAANIIEHELWGNFIILKRESLGSDEVIKFIRVLSATLFKIETKNGQNTI
jgi:hypothetical protein